MSVEHCRAGIVQLCKDGASRFRVALQRKVNLNKNDSKINSVYFQCIMVFCLRIFETINGNQRTLMLFSYPHFCLISLNYPFRNFL